MVGLLVYVLGAAPAAINTAVQETGTMLLAPTDTYLNTNRKNYSTATTVSAYTWPDFKPANAILMKFDLSALPAGAVVTEATAGSSRPVERSQRPEVSRCVHCSF